MPGVRLARALREAGGVLGFQPPQHQQACLFTDVPCLFGAVCSPESPRAKQVGRTRRLLFVLLAR